LLSGYRVYVSVHELRIYVITTAQLKAEDASRDEALRRAGLTVVRIPSAHG